MHHSLPLRWAWLACLVLIFFFKNSMETAGLLTLSGRDRSFVFHQGNKTNSQVSLAVNFHFLVTVNIFGNELESVKQEFCHRS